MYRLAMPRPPLRPTTGRSSASKGGTPAATDHNAKTHDYTLFKSMLDSLTDLAQSRLLAIIRNRKRLVDTLPRGVRHHRAHSVASPAHHQAAPQQEAATHTHTGLARLEP